MIKQLGFGSGATAVGQGKHTDQADGLGLREGQGVASGDAMAGFAAGLAIQPQATRGDDFGSNFAGFEKPGRTEPFVQPKFRLDVLVWFRTGARQIRP